MGIDVYSTLFETNPSLSATDTYTVPAGMVAVLRDIDGIFGSNITPGEFQLWGVADAVLWDYVQPIVGAASFTWRGRQVFNPGDTLKFVAVSQTCSYAASGYLLTLP